MQILKYSLRNWRMTLGTYLHGHSRVVQTSGLGTIASFVATSWTGFGTHSFIRWCYMHVFQSPFHWLLLLHAQVLLGFGCWWCFHVQDELFACLLCYFSIVLISKVCRMSSRGISCYRIPVGCPVAASPPGMQAKWVGLYCQWGIQMMRSPDGDWQVGRVKHHC